ncbi:hypothetical protein CLAFUW4_02697 [Fulvia fulva]|uniref:uncharacterized protein n=1 Tax=Passalora fulva TaxID=5499 RepID=UPI0028528949|nr:uncharacterized protein CLAFUR5_20146 [Fulvia fulva]KAK4631064.1 hypothetical protein CLAFUR4_02692 [Fulvia fulva]KAK4633680.1 hypothetical protein CLAFUR0_02694 [Fulvia fulva]WMI38784.1 hypothetical protein CLAFUR5_20146 [Fulvia fulva]WPV10483.1 hypothetical protein CLAFUW4_02697 [Fulvia fulva]WPV26570.1 hypothetical protein CLAFUW7_02696 [Fulvia fulva]
MAAVLLIWGAVTIRERIEKAAEEKRAKKERDAMRYAELQEETERRLSLRRSESGNHTVVGKVVDAEEEEEEDDRWWEEPSMRVPVHEPQSQPPAAARSGGVEVRREREDAITEKKSSRRRRGIKNFLRPTPA